MRTNWATTFPRQPITYHRMESCPTEKKFAFTCRRSGSHALAYAVALLTRKRYTYLCARSHWWAAFLYSGSVWKRQRRRRRRRWRAVCFLLTMPISCRVLGKERNYIFGFSMCAFALALILRRICRILIVHIDSSTLCWQQFCVCVLCRAWLPAKRLRGHANKFATADDEDIEADDSVDGQEPRSNSSVANSENMISEDVCARVRSQPSLENSVLRAYQRDPNQTNTWCAGSAIWCCAMCVCDTSAAQTSELDTFYSKEFSAVRLMGVWRTADNSYIYNLMEID